MDIRRVLDGDKANAFNKQGEIIKPVPLPQGGGEVSPHGMSNLFPKQEYYPGLEFTQLKGKVRQTGAYLLSVGVTKLARPVQGRALNHIGTVSKGQGTQRVDFTGIVCRKPVTSVMWRNAHALDFNNEHTTLLNITVNCYT